MSRALREVTKHTQSQKTETDSPVLEDLSHSSKKRSVLVCLPGFILYVPLSLSQSEIQSFGLCREMNLLTSKNGLSSK